MSGAFFDKIIIQRGWSVLGRKDFDGSVGAVIKISEELTLRIFVLTTSGKGGIAEKRFNRAKREFQYKCLISNKTAEEINEYLTKNYKNDYRS